MVTAVSNMSAEWFATLITTVVVECAPMAVSRLAKMTALGAPQCGKPSMTKAATETRASTTIGPTKTATKRKRTEIASATTILARRRNDSRISFVSDYTPTQMSSVEQNATFDYMIVFVALEAIEIRLFDVSIKINIFKVDDSPQT